MTTLHRGDCLEVLRGMPDNSVDSIVTDPPYGLSFMGKRWDYDVPAVEVWAECLRVLKPGGHLLAFAGTRTQHRMAVRIEDAGFEIRDMIAWVYGSGMPKHRSLLKPALEPITVARKPLGTCATNVLQMVESQLRERGVRGEILWKPENASGAARSKKTTSSGSTRPLEASETFAKNADESVTRSVEQQSLKSSEKHGTSGINPTLGGSESFHGFTTSGCENPLSPPTAGSAPAAESVSVISSPSTTSTAEEHSTENKFTGRSTHNCAEKDSRLDTASFAGIATGLTGSMGTVHISRDSEGFFLWPNGLPEFVPGSPLTVAANVLAHGTGGLNIDGCKVGGDAGRWPANLIHDGSDEVLAGFPVAKSGGSLHQRSLGRGACFGKFTPGRNVARAADTGSAARFFYTAKVSKRERNDGLPDGMTNTHPTLKPVSLMAYLCRLVTPPGGTVLDPFMGSGSTGKAAMREGFRFIGIEREAEYLAIAQARIKHASQDGRLL